MIDSRVSGVLALVGMILLQIAAVSMSLHPQGVLIAQAVVAMLPLSLLPFSRRPIPNLSKVLMAGLVCGALVLGSWVCGDWQYHRGMATVGVDDAKARTHLIAALSRAEGPGTSIPFTRVRITRFGLVSEFLVTPRIALANIELRAGNLDTAEGLVEDALAAARSDSREECDVEFLERMLRSIHAKRVSGS